MGMSAYYRKKSMDQFALEASRLSLHTGPPGDDGENEVNGDGYQRQAVTFADATADGVEVAHEVEFRDMPAGNPTHLAYWDDFGRLLWSGVIPVITGPHDDTPRVLERGGILGFPVGRLEVGFD